MASARGEWTQDAHDSQRTGATEEEPLTPWSFAWTWNGPDDKGGISAHLYDAPREGRVITGGDFVFVPAGSAGLVALRKADGTEAWRFRETSFDASPAYDARAGELYAAGANGRLYKFAAEDGKVVASYDSGAPIHKALLLTADAAYVINDDGALDKVLLATMQRAWRYDPHSPVATMAAFSAAQDLVVFATRDLFVHAIHAADGNSSWRVKPTSLPAGFPNEMDGGWPVIAEQHGIVFIRMRLDHQRGLWGGPGPKAMYPDTCAETRAFVTAHPELQSLFALQLKDGASAFLPAVGYGGVEALENGKPFLDIGGMPVVRTFPSGEEVVYTQFRSGQRRPPDGRWDSNLGEMVLDDHTIPGLVAGDLRFVDFARSMVHITDEQCPLTMAGSTIFHAHWGASESTRILDRSPALGLTFAAPISTEANPPIVRRIKPVSDFNPLTHWTKSGLTLYDDGRYWPGPGWWVYWDCYDPPTPRRSAYSEGRRPRYTIVSGDLLIAEGNGGELFVLRYSGNRDSK